MTDVGGTLPPVGPPVVSFDSAAASELTAALLTLRARLAELGQVEAGAAAPAEADWRGPLHGEFTADRQGLRAELSSASTAVDDQLRALATARQLAVTRQASLNTLHDLWTHDCLRATFLHQPLPPYPDLPN